MLPRGVLRANGPERRQGELTEFDTIPVVCGGETSNGFAGEMSYQQGKLSKRITKTSPTKGR